jgi:hypothetical protein
MGDASQSDAKAVNNVLPLSLAPTSSHFADQPRLWPSFANRLLFVTDYELVTR